MRDDFARMHNEYLDPDRHSQQEQPLALHEDRTLKGYGKRGHGLNGKDADLDSIGQNVVDSAWWFAEGDIQIEGSRYATLALDEEWDEDKKNIAQEIVCGTNLPAEWDGDAWVFNQDYALKLHLDWDDSKTEDENLSAATEAVLDAINQDSKAFENEITELHKSFDELDKEA